MRQFRLYPTEQAWWSMADYAAVLDVMARLHPVRVLEFGPGSSTLALIEGGAQHVDCCEDDPVWFATYCERLEDRFPGVVTMVPYRWADPLSITGLNGQRYDLALIDGPRETTRRPAVVEYCLPRCTSVLVPLECAQGSRLMRETCEDLAGKHDRTIEITETGPLSGAFALLS